MSEKGVLVALLGTGGFVLALALLAPKPPPREPIEERACAILRQRNCDEGWPITSSHGMAHHTKGCADKLAEPVARCIISAADTPVDFAIVPAPIDSIRRCGAACEGGR